MESIFNFLVRFQHELVDVQVHGGNFSDARKKAKLERALSNKEDALRALNTSLQLMELTYQEACLRVIAFDQTENDMARLKAKVRNSVSNVEDNVSLVQLRKENKEREKYARLVKSLETLLSFVGHFIQS